MSLRFKLAILNALIVLLALGIGSWLLISQARRAYIGSIDRELLQRAGRFSGANMGPLPELGPPEGQGQPNGQGQPGGPGMGQGQRQGQPGGPGTGQGQNQFPGQGQPGGPGQQGEPRFRFAGEGDIGRPRVYGENGDPIRKDGDPIIDRHALRDVQDRPILSTLMYEGRKVRVITAPVRRPWFQGKVQFAADLGEFERMNQNQMGTALILLPLSIIFSATLGWFMAGLATRPINRMSEATTKISPDRLSDRLEGYGSDEVGKLAASFNTMLQRLEVSATEREKLMEHLKESLEQQKRFVSDASHELRTPLTRIRLASSSVDEQDLTSDEMKESLTMIDKEAVGMTELVEQLLALARLDSGATLQTRSINVKNLFAQLSDEFAKDSRVKWIPVADELAVTCHEPSTIRALRNLIENARKYTPEGGEIHIEATKLAEGVQIRVSDNGSGIEPEHLARLTERFYRVDDSRNRSIGGTGLGLAIVKGIMDQHKGEIQVQSRVGSGTAATLFFPN